MNKKYASLHNHTHYSNLKLIDSINREDELIDKAYELGLSSIAITDHDSVSGHIKALQHYKKHYKDKNFKLILGNEIYLTREGLTAENHEKGEKFYHVILLAKDAIGHEQIRKLSTRAWSRGYMRAIMRTPTYGSDLHEIIGQNKGHVIATTACLGGVTGSMYLTHGEHALASIRDFLEKMENLFGKNNFYIELQPSNNVDQIKYNKSMIDNFWGKFPFIFATDSHYLTKEERTIHKYFLNSKSTSEREVDEFYSATYIMSFDEVKNYFIDYIDEDKIEEMRQNTLKIEDMCEFYDFEHKPIVPEIKFVLKDEKLDKEYANFIKNNMEKYPYILKYATSPQEVDRYFLLKIFDGFKKLIGKPTYKYMDRIEYELEQLWEISIKIEQPISKYFVTMSKIIDIIWNEGDSLVGVSRGSAAGFLINYCLGITQIDPLNQPLEMPAWRFMHKDRPGLPDIDIDTEGAKRKKVFNKVRDYFLSIGGDLINVCTFGTEKSKSAIRTAARGLNIDDDIVNYIVSLIPNERGADWTLTQCMYGDDEKKPIPQFQKEMEKYPLLWKVASKIEGLITRLGIHAAGVIAVNEDFTKHNSIMKTSKGVLVSAFNLEDTEYTGGIKYDFLTINALDKIRTTLNLLLEDNIIQWQESLRDTYEKYLLPKNLDYNSPKMWEMAYTGKIVDLFQFDTQVGAQAIKSIKPQSITELAVANSLMRLMPQGADELPADTYIKYKNNIELWYNEMRRYGLNDKEIEILKKYLEPLSGVADSQESVMMLTMDPNIANFTVAEANSLRKAIAKKKADVLEKTKKMFYEKGLKHARKELLDYVWNKQIGRQIGYSFSILHTMGYSTIALQEMNLAFYFPLIYWTTACLSVNAGAMNDEDYEELIEQGIIEVTEDENKRESTKVQYGKIASAISGFKYMKIELPDINIAKFGFTPNAAKNTIVFGLKGITRIGDNLIQEIIKRRPYKSLEDFLEKMIEGNKKLISKDRVVNLIKAGAFDNIEQSSRVDILKKYIKLVVPPKQRINLNNMLMLIRNNLIPEELEEEKRIYMFTKYIRKFKHRDEYYILDDVAMDFYNEKGFDFDIYNFKDNGNIITCIKKTEWESYYNSRMNNVRQWMKDNQEELLQKLNQKLFDDEYGKYSGGEDNILKWELDSLNFYYSGHELADIELPVSISKLDELDMEVIGYFNIKGKQIPKYKLHCIAGTILDKDKTKHIVTLATVDGVIDVKLYRSQFAKYDKVIYHEENGEKIIDQPSFLEKGTFLCIIGIKRGDIFIPKVYKETGMEAINKIIIENNKLVRFEAKR